MTHYFPRQPIFDLGAAVPKTTVEDYNINRERMRKKVFIGSVQKELKSVQEELDKIDKNRNEKMNVDTGKEGQLKKRKASLEEKIGKEEQLKNVSKRQKLEHCDF